MTARTRALAGCFALVAVLLAAVVLAAAVAS